MPPLETDGTAPPEAAAWLASGIEGAYRQPPAVQQAMGAVEAASTNKAFGALPPGYREDILPVTFRFTPSLGR